MEEIKRIKALLAEDRPGDWEALPDIDLYMDQVVSYLPRQSVGGKAPAMTPAMINNYVKDGLMPRACGKRYHKEHLIYLTAIGLLKNVLTVKDMKLLLDREVSEGQEQTFYEKLLKGIDEAAELAGCKHFTGYLASGAFADLVQKLLSENSHVIVGSFCRCELPVIAVITFRLMIAIVLAVAAAGAEAEHKHNSEGKCYEFSEILHFFLLFLIFFFIQNPLRQADVAARVKALPHRLLS